MDLQKLIARMDQIESRPSLQEALTLADVGAAEKQASDAAAAVKQKGGFASFTGWDPKTAGDIALSGLATKNGLPGLMNSKGEFVVAGDGQQKPKIAPPNGDDTKALQAAGLISGNAQGPSGLANFLSGGKAQQEFGVKKQDSMKTNATNTSNAMIKDIIPKITALLDKAEQEAGGVKETISFSSGIAKALAEGLGYNLKEDAMEELAPLMAQVADIEDPALKPLQDRYAALMNKPAAAPQTSMDDSDDANAKPFVPPTPGQTATPTPGGPSSQDLTGAAGAAGEAVGKKLQRFKELLAKASSKGSATQTATPAAGGKDPLAADPISANAKPKEESRLSEAEKYAALRDRLLMIETRVDEGPLDFAKGAYNVGKNFFGGLGGKMAQGTTKTAAELATSQAATNAARVAAGKKALSAAQLAQQAKAGIGATNAATGAAKFANKAGTTIAKNPIKTALGATAVGAGAAYALSGDAKKSEADVVTPPKVPGTVVPPKVPGQTGTPVPGSAYSPEEMKELDMLAREFGDSEDPEIAALLKQYSDVKNSALK